MKASIIIPVKNASSSLLKTLHSISQQDLALIEEVIIVENGSREIKNLKEPHFKIVYFHLSEASRSKARNLGARHAQAPALVFLDADVIIGPNWLSVMLHHLERKDSLAVQSPIIPDSDKNNRLQKIRKARIFFNNEQSYFSLKKDQDRKIVLNSSAFAIRKETFSRVGGFDPHLIRHEDLDFTQRLLGIEGQLKAISSVSCRVYFDSDLRAYFLRELDCGLQIVRYHEKWHSRSAIESYQHFSHNLRKLIYRYSQLSSKTQFDKDIYFLELTYLLGNFIGIFLKVIRPYPNRVNTLEEKKAQVVFL